MNRSSILSSATRGLALAALLTGASTSLADVKLPALFGDHMVLQQDMSAPVWGTAMPLRRMTITIRTMSSRSRSSQTRLPDLACMFKTQLT